MHTKMSLRAKIAIALGSAAYSLVGLAYAPPAASAHSTDVAKTTTYEIGKLALARYPHGFYLTGGAGAAVCDPYAPTLPTKIYCEQPTSVGGMCVTSVIMDAQTNATGEVICGRKTGAHKWVFSVNYRWHPKSRTYTWTKPEMVGSIR